MHKLLQRIEFYRKIGRSGRIAIPELFKDLLEGRVVRVTIEVLDSEGG